MSIDSAATTPDRIRRALAGADRELYRLGSTRVRRYVITTADLAGGDQTSQRFILDILPPGTQLRGQFIAIEKPFESVDGQAVTARGYRTFAPSSDASTWVAATSAANIGPTNAPGTTIGGDEGFVCWGAPIVYALDITGTNLQLLTRGKITVSLVLAPLREIADDENADLTRFGPTDGAATPSVLTTGTGSGGTPAPTELADLTDVAFYDLQLGDVLTWNGTTWSNQDPDLAATSKTWDYGDASGIYSGFALDFRDASSTLIADFDFGDSAAVVSP